MHAWRIFFPEAACLDAMAISANAQAEKLLVLEKSMKIFHQGPLLQYDQPPRELIIPPAPDTIQFWLNRQKYS